MVHGFNAALLGSAAKAFPVPAGGGGSSLSFVEASYSTGAGIAIPNSVQGGDLLVLLMGAFAENAAPADLTPTGWTHIGYLAEPGAGPDLSVAAKYKIAAGTFGGSSSDAGATVTGWNGTTDGKTILVFRPANEISTVTPASYNAYAEEGAPTNQTIAASGGTAPLVAIAHYFADAGISTRGFSPAADAELNDGANNNQYAKYKIYGASPSDITASMNNAGSDNGLQSFYVEISGNGGGGGGGPFTFSDTVSTDLVDQEYDVAAAATNAGWNGTDVVEATITVSAKIRGPRRTGGLTFAFDTGNLPAGSTVDVTVTGTGRIWGGGGDGGSGGTSGGDGGAGKAGGAAMNFRVDGSVSINAGGEVISGSGGGGGQGGGWTPDFEVGQCFESSGLKGGGGWPNGNVGGSESGPGTSGGSTGGNKNANDATAGASGGGALGPCSGQPVGNGGGPGAQGIGIRKNGNTVTVTNNGVLGGNPAEQA